MVGHERRGGAAGTRPPLRPRMCCVDWSTHRRKYADPIKRHRQVVDPVPEKNADPMEQNRQEIGRSSPEKYADRPPATSEKNMSIQKKIRRSRPCAGTGGDPFGTMTPSGRVATISTAIRVRTVSPTYTTTRPRSSRRPAPPTLVVPAVHNGARGDSERPDQPDGSPAPLTVPAACRWERRACPQLFQKRMFPEHPEAGRAG